MNEKEARKEGLTYAGPTANPWNKEECEKLKAQAAEIRAMGFRAVVVQSGATEWGGGHKLLYVDRNYMTYGYLKQNAPRSDGQKIIEAAKNRCADIMEQAYHEQEVLDKRVADERARLIEAGFGNLEGVQPSKTPKLIPMPCAYRSGSDCKAVTADSKPRCAFLRDGAKCGCVTEGVDA